MSFNITVEHSNPGSVSKKLDALNRIQKEDLIMKTVNTKLEELYKIIYKVIPVKTGYMRSTMAVRTGDAMSELVVTARYAGYVEKGTQGRHARPFFLDNVVRMETEIIIAVRSLYMSIK